MRFALPWFLLVLSITPVLVWKELKWSRKTSSVIRFSGVKNLKESVITFRLKIFKIMPYASIVCLSLLIIALARPQTVSGRNELYSEGIAIVLVIDASGSMEAEDFKPKNRLHVAKEVVKKFVEKRHADQIGLVIFGERSFTQCPLTLDHRVLLRLIDSVRMGIVPKDRTAIGMALATALNRLRDVEAKSKVIVLLTDGMNNAGKIDPTTAAEMASSLGVKVYTIGIGKEGTAAIPVNHPVFGKQYAQIETDVDEQTLAQIADKTGGFFFRATSPQMLEDVYIKIDQLEKTKIEARSYTNYNELVKYFVWPALFLFSVQLLLSLTWLRKVP